MEVRRKAYDWRRRETGVATLTLDNPGFLVEGAEHRLALFNHLTTFAPVPAQRSRTMSTIVKEGGKGVDVTIAANEEDSGFAGDSEPPEPFLLAVSVALDRETLSFIGVGVTEQMRESHFGGCPSGNGVLSMALCERLFAELLGYELDVEVAGGISDVLHEVMDLLEPSGTGACRDPLDAVIHAYKVDVQNERGDWCHRMFSAQRLPTMPRPVAGRSSFIVGHPAEQEKRLSATLWWLAPLYS